MLRIANNNFGGTIDPNIGNVVNLRAFYIFVNSIEGTIPESLGNCKSFFLLTSLYVVLCVVFGI